MFEIVIETVIDLEQIAQIVECVGDFLGLVRSLRVAMHAWSHRSRLWDYKGQTEYVDIGSD